MPDLSAMCKEYQDASDEEHRAIQFMRHTDLGVEKKRSFADRIVKVFGNSGHNWLWDFGSTAEALRAIGFSDIRPCEYHDSEIDAFRLVERLSRFQGGFAVEARKGCVSPE
jgi:hypothetical protein